MISWIISALFLTEYAMMAMSMPMVISHQAKERNHEEIHLLSQVSSSKISSSHEKYDYFMMKTQEMKSLLEQKMNSLFGKMEIHSTTQRSLRSSNFDDYSSNLRGLQRQDNFVIYSTFVDSNCEGEMLTGFGAYVNKCFNDEVDGGSFIYKINRNKRNLLAKFSYSLFNCEGEPFMNIMIPNANSPQMNSCSAIPGGSECCNASSHHLLSTSTYPNMNNFPSGYYVSERFEDVASCSLNHVNYSSYTALPVDWLFQPDCNNNITESYQYYTGLCSKERQVYTAFYSTPDCTGKPYQLIPLLNSQCTLNDDDNQYAKLMIEFCT